MKKNKILLVNDDSFLAFGLCALEEILGEKHEVIKVAPRFEQSAKSHALTMHEPVFIKELSSNSFWIQGTPADCVYVALHHLRLDVDVVISGINHGTNLGTDVWYSGTVAAAREAAFHNILSFAVSTEPLENTLAFYIKQAKKISQFLPQLLSLNKGLYNINLSLEDSKKLHWAPLGHRLYQSIVDVRQNSRGKEYCWIGGPPVGYKGSESCDLALFAKGCSTITPLTLLGTADIPTQESGNLRQIHATTPEIS